MDPYNERLNFLSESLLELSARLELSLPVGSPFQGFAAGFTELQQELERDIARAMLSGQSNSATLLRTLSHSAVPTQLRPHNLFELAEYWTRHGKPPVAYPVLQRYMRLLFQRLPYDAKNNAPLVDHDQWRQNTLPPGFYRLSPSLSHSEYLWVLPINDMHTLDVTLKDADWDPITIKINSKLPWEPNWINGHDCFELVRGDQVSAAVLEWLPHETRGGLPERFDEATREKLQEFEASLEHDQVIECATHGYRYCTETKSWVGYLVSHPPRNPTAVGKVLPLREQAAKAIVIPREFVEFKGMYPITTGTTE